MIHKTTEIIINGKRYNSLDELSPEQREQFERAMKQVQQIASGKMFSFAVKLLGGKETEKEILGQLSFDRTTVIDVEHSETVDTQGAPGTEPARAAATFKPPLPVSRLAAERSMTQPVKFESAPLWPIVIALAAFACYLLLP